jgi:Endonuclease NucS
MIEFHHVVNRGEVTAYYLNLTDVAGRTYGREHFPPDKTSLVIRDGRDRDIQAKMRGRNQIWGGLKKWFQLNDIRSGARIVVRFNPDERKDDQPVVHLIPDAGAPMAESREPGETVSAPAVEDAPSEFPISLERQLEDFLVRNLNMIEPGLMLFRDDDGAEGRQYVTDVGVIDLLCQRSGGNLLVIELKRGKTSDVAVGQLARYIGYVRKHLAGDRSVSGLILAHDRDESLSYAVIGSHDVSVRYFKLRLELVAEDEL